MSSVNKNQKAGQILKILKKLFPEARIALKYKTAWQCLVAVQLSAQCTDKKVNEVTQKLFKKYRRLEDYLAVQPMEFEKDIYQTGFYKNKTRNILAAAKMVKAKWRGQLPKTMAEMLEIPGVARKTANVVLNSVYGVVEGIVVDTHVRRLSLAWGLTKETDPVKIERDLMTSLPKKDWSGWSYRVINYGRQFSPAHKKDHSFEPLAKFYLKTNGLGSR